MKTAINSFVSVLFSKFHLLQSKIPTSYFHSKTDFSVHTSVRYNHKFERKWITLPSPDIRFPPLPPPFIISIALPLFLTPVFYSLTGKKGCGHKLKQPDSRFGIDTLGMNRWYSITHVRQQISIHWLNNKLPHGNRENAYINANEVGKY